MVQDMDHHDVLLQTNTFKSILQNALGYTIDVIQSTDEKKWHAYNLQLSRYDLIVTSSLGFENLPEEPLLQIEQFIKNGAGLVVVHQGVGSYEETPKFQELIGIGWYGSHTGSHIFWNDVEKNFTETPIYHGVAPAHGKQHEITIDIRNQEHPITKGMPSKWIHGMDEFYHGMRGFTKNITILATAYSDKKMWGSGEHEPIAWTNSYGKGSVFVTVLGHVFNEDNAEDIPGINTSENGTNALYCVGFQTLFARGAQWAATGEVTLRLPVNFPTDQKTTVLHPEEVIWPK
ncbi:ThuA domain-containing protein [Arenibacter sp. GZD96]|uniref:ThuA domain-containing protein n=1 Tax=Aurantibrevibacter litoralis TaxID=3106030 RepID=UPI002AFF6A9F|nr:ThuA domain-containing protein [Arenibacter sp. GZD-96]MEA1786212.1 ThuA domain-containing protein [Arenibacter sp. GZD-96]